MKYSFGVIYMEKEAGETEWLQKIKKLNKQASKKKGKKVAKQSQEKKESCIHLLSTAVL